eukprot:TRINITY_DN872_c0_g1_i4.p1 TRINITY_DN872_c0_g1~~TRINITY_DN872_c0_g1_i4.p1  ORF type:complete len:255 (-),score=42.65 TRINITY_DN872_c0_g1_i4:275-1039(-)
MCIRDRHALLRSVAMNNNKTSEQALLGQYATSSYITLGDPYHKKSTNLPRYKGKQFQTNPAHKGRSKDTMFAKSFPWLSEGDKFQAQALYLKTQPRENRKNGFLSQDAHRRDEFSNTIRTEQYRWALGRELANQKMHAKNRPVEENQTPVRMAPPLAKIAPEFTTPKHLYDIGKGSSVTKFSQKMHRDCWYQAQRDPKKERRMGDYLPSSYEIGNEAVVSQELAKPTYANTPIISSTFYRVGSVKANAGWVPTR